MVASSPAATSCRAASPTTVRIRAESCEPSNCHECVYDRQEISDRKVSWWPAPRAASRRGTPPGVPRKFGTGSSPARSQDQTGSVKPT